MESYYYIKNSRKDYEYLLKKFSNYSCVETNIQRDFIYLNRFNDEQLMKLYNDYSLKRYQQEESEIKIFLKVLRWSHEILLYRIQ